MFKSKAAAELAVTQSAKCLTLDFHSGNDPRVMRLRPVLGSALGTVPV